MNLREALILQSPSLELLRAAAAEIARLDAQVQRLALLHYEAQARLATVHATLRGAMDFDAELDAKEVAPCGDEYNRLFGYVEAAVNCIAKETA